MTVTLNITGINAFQDLLKRLPFGEDARAVLQRLGAWNTELHLNAAARVRNFQSQLSGLEDAELSNMYGHWTSELMRMQQQSGLLDGLRKSLELNAKKSRAAARGRARRQVEEDAAVAKQEGRPVVRVTAKEIDDRAEEDEEVMHADEALVMLDVLLAGVHAGRESAAIGANALSREISFRQAQFTARVR